MKRNTSPSENMHKLFFIVAKFISMAAFKFILKSFIQLPPCILTSAMLPIPPAQADFTMEMRPPQVSKFVVTCEYINGVVSPLQIHIVEKSLTLSPCEITIMNVQNGLLRTVVPTRKSHDLGVSIFPILSLQTGIYDVKVWRGRWMISSSNPKEMTVAFRFKADPKSVTGLLAGAVSMR